MKSAIYGFTFLLIGITNAGCLAGQAQGSAFSGRVNRVWEDGFELNHGGRSIIVDSYDICGDNTTRFITVGERVNVTGEFEGGEFDAFSMTRANSQRVCR